MWSGLIRRFSARTAEITAAELADALRAAAPPVLIDIRGAEQFAAAHLPGAINLPLEYLQARAGSLDPGAPTVVY